MLYKKPCFEIVVTGSGTRLHVTVSHYQSKKRKKRTGNTSVNLTITYTATISPRLHQIFSFDHTHDTVTSTITIMHKYDDGSLWYHQATPMWRVRKLTSAIHGRPLQPRYRKSCVACESSGVLNQTFFLTSQPLGGSPEKWRHHRGNRWLVCPQWKNGWVANIQTTHQARSTHNTYDLPEVKPSRHKASQRKRNS